MSPDLSDVEVGVERDSDVPVSADWYAYVDDGTHGVVWAVTRNDDYEVTVTTWLCEAGLIDRDTAAPVRHFAVDPDERTSRWAEQYAESHREAIETAREHFAADEEAES